MINTAILTSLISILILGVLEAVTVVNQHPAEEYSVEHEVLRKDAIEEARKLQLQLGPIPGCKPCTNSEMNYCRDGGVINDHCCCDGSSEKVFPFVEHTCYLGPEDCKIRADNCEEYSRLRDCCCHSYLGSIWKGIAGAAQSKTRMINFTEFLVILIILIFIV